MAQLSTMMSFDTGAWGEATQSGEDAVAERRRAREEREKEKKKHREEEAMKKKAELERIEREAEAAKKQAEKENRREMERMRKERASRPKTEVEKLEDQMAALKAAKKAKQQERSNAMQRAERARAAGGGGGRASDSSKQSKKPSTYSSEGVRQRCRVNPVTGQLEAIDESAYKNDGKVQEGSLRIDKKYMNAALAAGLGSRSGMYSHIGVVNKELNSSKNSGTRPRDGPQYTRESAGAALRAQPKRRSAKDASMSRVKATNVGGTTVHTIVSKTSDPTRRRLKKNPNFDRRGAGASDLGGNPVRGDQKRRPVAGVHKKKARGPKPSGSSYQKQKGVVSTLGGCTSSSSQRYAEKKQMEKANEGAPRPKPKRVHKPITRTLGGDTSKASSKDAASMRAARLAALERRGLA